MKIPFFNPFRPKFEPRKIFGQDPNLSPKQKDFLESFDVLEQKANWAVDMIVVMGFIVFVLVCINFSAFVEWCKAKFGL